VSQTSEALPGVQPGEPAPEFTLPAIHRDGTVSLSDYRGKRAVLLAIYRGLYCCFCRRTIAQLDRAYEPLKALGVEALAVVATEVANARLYFRFRPTRLPLLADPDLVTHRLYRLPRPEWTPAVDQLFADTPLDPTGELLAPLPLMTLAEELDRRDGFTPTPVDRRDEKRMFGQLKGQFLIDRDGIVRWQNVECATEGLLGFGKFPSNDQLLDAARTYL
jgi:peroxiredoxin